MVNETKNVLVLGGKGFLGGHVMNALAARGVEARSLSRKDGTDIRDLPALTEAVRSFSPDSIINCAAHVGSVHYAMEFSAEMIRDNILLALNTYEAVRLAAPHAKIINPLSNCSYPGDAEIQKESAWQNGMVHDSVLAFGSVKRLEHALAHSYRAQHGIRSVNWLVANAYGPGDHMDPHKVHALNGIIIRLMLAQKKGEKEFVIWGTGEPIREWVYIKDAAEILVHSLNIDEQIYPMNLAQNKGYSIAEIARIAAQALQYDVTFVFDTTKADGAPIKVLDDTRFRSTYPDFTFTPLAEGIAETIAYYRKRL